MDINIFETEEEMGAAAARDGAEIIRTAIEKNGEARIIVATGASQFTVLSNLIKEEGIDWSKVTGFHLDEYIGIDENHPASFRGYLRDRFVTQVPLKAFHYINGENDPEAECEKTGVALQEKPIDAAFIGIGENGHIAFNDPPADFETEKPYLVVELDDACRQQQFGEGWFPTFEDVPQKAISMSVNQILKSGRVFCSVPDERKSEAVAGCVNGQVTPDCPASIMQDKDYISLYLDKPAASKLDVEV